MSWTALLLLAAGSFSFKLTGVLLGGRIQQGPLHRAVQLIPPALFSALILLQTFEQAGSLTVDARAVGFVVAVVATVRRVPFIGVILLAMAATACTRLVLG